MDQTISPDNKLADILDFDKCKQLVKEAIEKKDKCVILCPHYSINVQMKYEDGEALQYDLDELNDYIGETIEVSDYDDLIVDLSYLTSYVVNVGNIGNIPCADEEDANETFYNYVEQSKSNSGRAAGENVILSLNDEIIKEYIGTLDREDEY